MQILYTANERHDAQLAAQAIRGVAQDVRVVWAARLSDAGRWVSENRDRLAAIVVDAEVQHQSCVPFVRLVRTLGLTTPILVVVPETAERPVAVLEAGADEFVLKNQSLGANLARLVSEPLRREQTEQRLQTLSTDNERLRETEARLQARLADALTLLQHRDADVEATTARLRTREAELAEATRALRALDQGRAELEETFNDLVHRSTQERFAAAQQAAQRQSEFETALADRVAKQDALDRELAATREGFRRRIAESETAFRDVEDRHASELNAAASAHAALEQLFAALEEQHAASTEAATAQHAAQRSDYEARLAGEAAARVALDQQLRDAERTVALIQQDLAASDEKLAEAESARAALEQRFAALEQQHAASTEAAAGQLAAQQSDYEARLAEQTAAREALDQQLRDAERRVVLIRQDLAASVEKLAEAESARRDSEDRYSSELKAAAAAHAALAERIATLEQQHASSIEAASVRLAGQQSEYEARFAEQTTAREAVERQLRDAEAAWVQAQREHESNAAAAADRLARRESELAAAAAARLTLEQRLVEAEMALAQAREHGVAERAAAVKQAARRQAEFDAQLAREVDARNAAERDHAGAIERLTSDHTAELLRLEALAAERDAQLTDQAARFDAAQRTAQQSLATLDGELRAALAAQSRQIEELNGELKTMTQELNATKNHRDALQLEAHRAPALARQLAASRAETRQHFAQIPVNILRCSHEGALREANHAMVSTLGYRTMDELRALDFPASVFEFAEDLRWLVQRCQNGPRQLADCIVKKKDGTRVNMRLRATQVSAETIEIVAEDLTSLRAMEEQLRQARRMEAVGRLASEVAATCDDLLSNVNQNGNQLLATLRGDVTLHHQAQSIFADVTRAAGFLRQLSGYGLQQARALSPADVNKVLRDLEPVLKRVAGDEIELVLPKKTAALYVDVDAERVERVLVNVAAYGRARMPSGGRLIVELSRVAVNHDFVAKHPNVREGSHAMIRVGLRDAFPDAPRGAASERPGLDLGALQALIGDCGGHLWMNAEPGGDMEMKIRLPLRSPERHTQIPGSGAVNAVARWFQS